MITSISFHKMRYIAVLGLMFLTLSYSCKKDDNTEQTNPNITTSVQSKGEANVVIKFLHKVDGKDLVIDSMMYNNAAGNPYEVNELKYFISGVTFYKHGGESVVLNELNGVRYIDISIDSTMQWAITQKLVAGGYDSIAFTFGIIPELNIAGKFVNAPEKDMAWPGYLGGGYHYMMINGKWENKQNQKSIFNFHLGTGQIKEGDVIKSFVNNQFRVSLPASSFVLADKETKTINLVMNIQSWFDSPNIWNHDVIGGKIMQNQAAQLMAKENGCNVFSIEIPSK